MVTLPSITVFARLVSALPALVWLILCNYLVFIHDHFHHDTFGLFENRVKIRSLWLKPRERVSETFIDFLAHPSISGHLRRLILNSAAYDDPFTKWQTQQMLKIGSGSLLDLRLEMEYYDPFGGTKTEVFAAGLARLSFRDHTSLQRLRLKIYSCHAIFQPEHIVSSVVFSQARPTSRNRDSFHLVSTSRCSQRGEGGIEKVVSNLRARPSRRNGQSFFI
ncbi:uncharacterized protein LAESUDRAFT_247453 [Laetiporus sulphureus 93-53]|uniref:Uncharacterized protein n=1 Tax=Laetiporus sulphureus 93-53 TaxID=1314785 RepID=A0A165DI34_9APHY|nr:uncharacterized protein LAESUDRAFT_247453 [Laetiporus sulphureus 93-53]KZT04930.1 hypothetical protein LAESUDRAFT_247453 [Laetiporus sulphureus 93-53]